MKIRRCGTLPLRRRGASSNLQPQIRVNGRIRAREVRVIMGSTSEQLGVMRLNDALRKAQSLGLDLVEIAPTANPPVCKIIDFGKFRYDISKQTKDKKPAGARLKEIKFRVNIDDHDYLTKIRHGEEFLDRGNKVRVQLQFRGREMAHQEFGKQLTKASPPFRRTARKRTRRGDPPSPISRGEYASQGVRAAAGDAFGDLAGGGGSGAFAACRASNRALRVFAS